MAQPGVAIAIEFGQMNTALSAIMGMGRGLTEQRGLTRAIGEMAESSAKTFRRRADAAAAAGEIAHVYEYGSEGTVAGRLWSLHFTQRAGDTVGNIIFRKARNPSSPSSALQEQAGRAGRTLATHLFPDKASHLETRQTLTSVAGVQRYTTRIGGDVDKPRTLVYIDNSGNAKFARRVTRENKFYRKFQQFFTGYWATQMTANAEPRVMRALSASTKFGAAEVNKVARMSAFRPVLPRGMAGVFATDRGKPYTGVRLSTNTSNRVEKVVQKKLERELVRQWGR